MVILLNQDLHNTYTPIYPLLISFLKKKNPNCALLTTLFKHKKSFFYINYCVRNTLLLLCLLKVQLKDKS